MALPDEIESGVVANSPIQYQFFFFYYVKRVGVRILTRFMSVNDSQIYYRYREKSEKRGAKYSFRC